MSMRFRVGAYKMKAELKRAKGRNKDQKDEIKRRIFDAIS